MEGRKIDSNQENIFDNFFLVIAEWISPFFYQIGFTPNLITTLSFVFGVLSIWYLVHDQYTWAGLLYIVSYFFDVMDGYFARRYNMVSDHGDLYDHVKDVVVFVTLLVVYLRKPDIPYGVKKFFVIILAILYLLSMVYMGCQETIYAELNPGESPSLEFTQMLCPDPQLIGLVKWFGTGTFNVVFAILLILTPSLSRYNQRQC